MREIKFRAWYKEGMLNETCICENHSGVLMQYTGLKDKNNKEIYEGDICIVHDFEKLKVEVRFRKETASFEGHNPKEIFPWVELSPTYYEIIGNIYENPELLTKD